MLIHDWCSGLGGASKAFRERGHEVITLDLDRRFGCDVTMDLMDVALDTFGGRRPDFIWFSPPCECFSVASISTHWTGGWRNYIPKNPRAEQAIRLLEHGVRLIKEFDPRLGFIIENPRGVMRKMKCLEHLERRTVTYCQYGETRMKPTDLWGGFPSMLRLKPICKNGDPCHVRAPRGAKTGTQGIKGSALRAEVPYELSLAMCIAVELEAEIREPMIMEVGV